MIAPKVVKVDFLVLCHNGHQSDLSEKDITDANPTGVFVTWACKRCPKSKGRWPKSPTFTVNIW